jgi:hypothetical protein
VNRPVIVACIILMLIASACGGENDPTAIPTQSGTATPNEVLVTLDTTQLSRDLPPTWTPTYTPTVTLTPTPSATFTTTPSPTPIDIELLCEDFRYSLPEDGKTYDKHDVISVSYGISMTYNYVHVGMILDHTDTAEVIDGFLPGGTSYNVNLTVEDLPLSGRWDYRIGVFILNDEDILCRQDGYFFIEEEIISTEQPNIIPTALPVPSITPEVKATVVGCSTAC